MRENGAWTGALEPETLKNTNAARIIKEYAWNKRVSASAS
jgi:hypothetical protein